MGLNFNSILNLLTINTMKNVKKLFFAFAILVSSALMTSCFDNSQEVFQLDETGNNSATVPDSNPEQWD